MDDFGRIVDRQGRLGNVSQCIGIVEFQLFDIAIAIDQIHPCIGLSHRSFHFRMSLMAYYDDFTAVFAVFCDFDMYFGNEWASGIEQFQLTGSGVFSDCL